MASSPRSRARRPRSPFSTGPVLAFALLITPWAAPSHAQVTPSAVAGRDRAAKVGVVRIHGNHTTPDEDVRQLAGVAEGEPLPEGGAEVIAARLDASRRFRRVDVRLRQRSIADPSDLALVIIVEEHPAPSAAPAPAPLRWLRNTGAGLMWLPVLDYEDAYGFTYGARFTFADAIGERSRVSIPATWGGTRRVAVEVERYLARPKGASLSAGGGIWQQEHPHYEVDERRVEGWLGATLPLRGPLRIEPRATWASVDFGGSTSDLFTGGADLVLDTRLNPVLPRNAVYLRLGLDGVRQEGRSTYRRTRADARAYVGLIGASVLAVRVRVEAASAPQPAYLQPWLGGSASLRGLSPGEFAGDQLMAFSAEVRVPFSSPLNVGTLGVAIFADAGAVGAHADPVSALAFERSVGAGVFLALPVVSINLDVAHAMGRGTRLHVATGVRF